MLTPISQRETPGPYNWWIPCKKYALFIFISVSTVCKEIRQHMQFKSEDATEAHKLKLDINVHMYSGILSDDSL